MSNHNNIPIVGQSKTWKDLDFKFGAILRPNEDPEGEPTVIGWQIGVFGTRSDELPFAAQFLIDATKITKDPIATALTVVNQAVVMLETYRDCQCVPNHTCLRHAKTPPLKQ